MRISDWSSDVCSSDLDLAAAARNHDAGGLAAGDEARKTGHFPNLAEHPVGCVEDRKIDVRADVENHPLERCGCLGLGEEGGNRSEERRVGKECGSTCRSRWSTCH